jgi:CheY-like chemotaxis protein
MIGAFAPHLMITDLNMPKMDGITLMHTSKERFPLIPVVAITGGLMTREEAEQLGFDGYILKPPVISELLEEVKRVLGEKVKSILVVDDMSEVRFILKEVLDRLSFNVIDVAGADEAIDILKAQPIDLVISDCSMPGMAGTEFLGYVKEHWPDLHFIVASASFPQEEVKRLKPDGFLRKPFDVEDLKKLVYTTLTHS